MTDAGQGLALKGADEVGGAQEDNTKKGHQHHESTVQPRRTVDYALVSAYSR